MTITWKLSDGTVVHLGGKVEGDSPLAKLLRAGTDGARRGEGPSCRPNPQPSASVRVDMNNEVHVDLWVGQYANGLGVAVLEGPDIPESSDPPPAPDRPGLIR